MTTAARRAQLERYREHYAERELDRYVVRNDGRDHRNPWTGLRRATERVRARLAPVSEALAG